MFLQKKRTRKLFLYLLVVSGLGILSGCSDMNTPLQSTQAGGTLNSAAAYKAASSIKKVDVSKMLGGSWRMLGDYGEFIHSADRNMKTQTTIKQLKKLHVNTYFYKIHHSAAAWRHLLKDFLPAAQKAGINVFVYLSCPEAAIGDKDPNPFGTDYIHWAKAIAHLSRKYSHLKGWAIDDFTYSLHTLTPSYVKKMQKSAHKINPKLIFAPEINYYLATSKSFHRKYGPYVDAIIVPYEVFYNLKPLPHQLDEITKMWGSKRVALMIYATKHGHILKPPPTQYVRKAVKIGLNYKKHGKLAGVIMYKLPKDPHKITCENLTHVLQFAVNWQTSTKTGVYVEASQKVRLNPGTHHYRISFWQQDDRHSSNPKGYHVKQFLVNGHVVWHKDVAKDGEKRYKVSLDLTKYLRGKSRATIAFRLYEKRGVGSYEVQVTLGGIRGHGFHVANNGCSDWIFKSTGSKVHRTYQCHECNPHKQQKMFDAVKKLYSKW
jgi:hypothetical protein